MNTPDTPAARTHPGVDTLPSQFEFLAPFVEHWGRLRTQNERYLKRQELRYEELEAFHATLSPRLEEIFSHLDKFDPQALPGPEELLFRTVLGLTEAAQAIEIFGQSRVPFAPFPHSVEQHWVGHNPH